MADADVHNALLAIYSRLGTIEGKVNLVARAQRDAILGALEEAFRKDPLLGQIYLLIDGKRTQQEILSELEDFGMPSSQPTVSRRMADLVSEYGVADPEARGGATVLRKNRAAEDVLNLSRRTRKWLERDRRTVPEKPATRVRKKTP